MKINKLLFCLLFSFASFTGFSQKVYFVYLQTEGEQAFFVKMGTKIYSSSASGYLILSKLRDSIYNITVGFPQNKWPEQKFSVVINKKDHGYLLKNFGEIGWGLFDLQTLSVQMAVTGTAKIEEKKTEVNKDVSAFTELLSKATDDPSLREKPVQTKVEKKEEAVAQETKANETLKENLKDTTAEKSIAKIEKIEVMKDEPKINKPEQPAAKVDEAERLESFRPTVITKRSESSTTEGFGLVFTDDLGNGINDTIRLLIPNQRPVVALIKEEPKEEKRFLDIIPDTAKKKDEPSSDLRPVVTENPGEKNLLKNNCTSVADESDFFKLRKNMAAAEGDENMLKEAKDYFKSKCFTTNQVKNLGLLFLNDEGKYKFFDLAYSYVADSEKFTVLQSELKDPYYINRFKAMLRN